MWLAPLRGDGGRMIDATGDSLPYRITAGDSVAWSRAFAGYAPGDGWTLRYTFVGATAVYTVDAAADGDGYRFAPAVDITATFMPGEYRLVESLVREVAAPTQEDPDATRTERATVGVARIAVDPDWAAATDPVDPRSAARRILDAIDAVLEKRATHGEQEVTINGRAIKYIPIPELLALRDRYRMDVAREDAACGGRPIVGRLSVRFAR
ncbi:MAG TPA: hypothetical protein VF265_01780 [Nevskiaceae bacterium]